MTSIRVTFDQNIFRKVIRSNEADSDAGYLLNAIKDGRITPLASATLFSLEGVTKAQRPDFIQNRDAKTETTSTASGESIRSTFSISPDHSTHSGMHEAHREDLERAIELGFKLIHLPRLGSPLPPELIFSDNKEKYDDIQHFHPQNELGGAVVRVIERNGGGYMHVKKLFERIEKRSGRRLNSKTDIFDNRLFNDNERNELKVAIAEWSDGDSVAAHIRHSGEVFCTADIAGKAGHKSVFSQSNRKILTDYYGVKFSTPEDLVKDFKEKMRISNL